MSDGGSGGDPNPGTESDSTRLLCQLTASRSAASYYKVRYVICFVLVAYFASRQFRYAAKALRTTASAAGTDPDGSDASYWAPFLPDMSAVRDGFVAGLGAASINSVRRANQTATRSNATTGIDTRPTSTRPSIVAATEQQSSTFSSTTASTNPNPNLPTIALTEPFLKGGFRNQVMRFHALLLQAQSKNISQILLPSLRWGDGVGGGIAIPHQTLFDVEYWNTYYPALPKLVSYDYAQHYQWDNSSRLLNVSMENPTKPGAPIQFLEEDEEKCTHPYRGGGGVKAGVLWNFYKRYTKAMIDEKKPRDRLEVLAYQALRPSPLLRNTTRELMSHLPDAIKTGDYITLHARVEPDMQKHGGACGELKTFNLTRILGFVEDEFRDDPPAGVFMPLNKHLLVEDAKPEAKNPVAIENLAVLNRIERRGMWGNQGRVFELGTAALDNDPRFDGIRNTAGSVINFYLALASKAFIGTPVSTYSVDVWTVRFFQSKLNNYRYLPWGLEKIGNDTKREPEPYACSVSF